MEIAIVVPAYRPHPKLAEFLARLAGAPVAAIVVVDDGSGEESRGVFEECGRVPRVQVLRHAVNLGKGAALKTGINHVLCALPGHGVVTCDADLQHEAGDVLKVAQALVRQREALVLGAREFSSQVPLRSRLGNRAARLAFRLVLGQRLSDTQTGLRGIPARLLPQLLAVPSSGYEFELDMLIAARHQGCAVVEVPIRAVYLEENRSSHFDPLLDSMRVSFVLLRFGAVSLLTAGLDNLVFWVAYGWVGNVAAAQAAGRLAAVAFNYGAARRAVFLSRERHARLLPKYLLLVLASGLLSYTLIGFLRSALGLPVFGAKLLAETALFLANFALQRDFVFVRRRERGAATDWNRYYAETPLAARLTRHYTAAVLVRALQRYGRARPVLVEIGGANSCFLAPVLRAVRPSAYHVIDINRYGLELLRQRCAPGVVLHQQDVRDLKVEMEADAVFSVGLIEHFSPAETRAALAGHFALARPGGCVIVSFPTPTRLYRAARALAEFCGVWRFPDERPLGREEVLEAAGERAELIYEKTLWPLVLTQHLMVMRKGAGAGAGR